MSLQAITSFLLGEKLAGKPLNKNSSVFVMSPTKCLIRS